ncbi:MAG: sortase [Actinomycetes bacterium]
MNRGRWTIQVIGWALIWTGLFIGGYVGWQLFGTDLLTGRIQEQALKDFDPGDASSQDVDVKDLLGELPPGIPSTVQLFEEPEAVYGEPVARIRIPDIEVDAVVFSGTERPILNKGPGHMPRTPLPGQPGNSVIAGHRTTYGRPFHDLDLLEPGDRIEVESAAGTHVYEVRETIIVKPTEIWVTDPRPGAWLTLITCNPKFSARERLIVFAEMVEGPNYDFVRVSQLTGAS